MVIPASPGNTFATVNNYDAQAQLSQQSAFGMQVFSQGHDPTDGTLRWRADGAGQTTSFTNYKRGIAQRVDYANGTVEFGTVNDLGLITSMTDARGLTWSYGYDNVGRLASIAPPGGFLGTTLTLEQTPEDSLGLGAGHWRHTIRKGNAETIRYLDAFLRPRLTLIRDITLESATRKVSVKSYDTAGQLSYESYVRRDLGDSGTSHPGHR